MTVRISLIILMWLWSLGGYAISGSAAAKAADVKTPEEKILSVDQIVNKTNYVAYYEGIDGRARVKMTITDSQGRQRNRELTILRWDQHDPNLPKKEQRKDSSFCGEQKIYAFFNRPADVYKTVFMVWKHLDKDDDRWMYLPALDLVKRISATDKRTSFVGTHFFYEDVSGRNINDDVHELIKTTKDYYVLKNTPKDPKIVEFAYFEMWIHRKSFVVVKTDYYNNQNKKYRSYEALEVKQIQGYPTVTKSIMTDLRTKGNTLLEYSDVKYDIGIPESIFTERYLRKPAKKYLR
ncbi:MAG: outer membrane lipoprotein-sorting protein [Deltaproteobacteria bacterium]|nr:outer membrane lipoprotein-sorting protein [Deltaproteobacteria bacterium]MDL1960473.1 outer membrane lipoprotein-sorting protein [Deltaproteobacteria bacterium]